MAAPKDPYMLVSWANMKLRDTYPSLSELAAAESVEEEEIRTRLSGVGYEYNEEKNQFVLPM